MAMIVDVEIPNMGLTITEATLLRWVRRPGDAVQKGEILFEIETDKATQEIESPQSGTVLALLACEGDVVPLGTVVAKIGTEAADRWDDRREQPGPSVSYQIAAAGSIAEARASQAIA